MRLVPDDEPLAPGGDLVVRTSTPRWERQQGRPAGRGGGWGAGAPHARGWHEGHQLADEVIQQFPVVEEAFVPDEVVADAGERDDVDPDGVVAVLLKGGRGQGGRDIGVKGLEVRVMAV